MTIKKIILAIFFKIQNIIDIAKCYLGIPVRLKTLDRDFLEYKILPYLNNISKSNSKLLFIGVAPYTKHYYQFLDYEVYTIDIDQKRKRYGNKSQHVVGSALDLGIHYKNNFDVIIANGLIGYGLDNEVHFIKFLKQCNKLLNRNSILIIGYNNNFEHYKFSRPIEYYLNNFEIFIPKIQGVISQSINVNPENDHTYMFLRNN